MTNNSQLLSAVTIDLTALAQKGQFDALILRSSELEQLIAILCTGGNKNPVLVGERGVGKSAIVHELAGRIAKQEVPKTLLGKRILQFEAGAFFGGYLSPADYEKRFRRLMEELKTAACILVIDSIMNNRDTFKSIDAFNTLKTALEHGEITCIGEMTPLELAIFQEAEPDLMQYFQIIPVSEPSIDETLQILRAVKALYENHHGIVIMDEAIVAAIQLSSKYITDQYLPDKALNLIDEGAARLRYTKRPLLRRISRIERELVDIGNEINELSAEMTPASLDELRRRKTELVAELSTLKAMLDTESEELFLTAQNISEIVALYTKPG